MSKEPTNTQRAEWARPALETFLVTSPDYTGVDTKTAVECLNGEPVAQAIGDLIGNLAHLANILPPEGGTSGFQVLEQGREHYVAEIYEHLADSDSRWKRWTLDEKGIAQHPYEFDYNQLVSPPLEDADPCFAEQCFQYLFNSVVGVPIYIPPEQGDHGHAYILLRTQ